MNGEYDFSFLGEEYSVTLLENNTYQIVKNANGKEDGFQMYIPCNIRGTTDLIGSLPGDGGSEELDMIALTNKATSQDLTATYVVSNNWQDSENIMENAYGILDKLAIGVNNVGTTCFSHSGNQGFTSINGLISNHKDEITGFNVVISTDGYMDENSSGFEGLEIEELKGDNTLAIIIGAPEGYYHASEVRKNAEKLAELGINVVWVTSKVTGHGKMGEQTIENDLMEYVLGIGEFKNKDDYIFHKLDENGKFIEIDFDEYLQTFRENYVINANYNLSLFNQLSNIENIENCNFAFIKENVNIIRNKIKTSNFLTQNINISTNSTSSVPSKENDLLYKIYDEIANLYEKLECDTRNIATIGNIYHDLDNFYKILIEKITDNNMGTITDEDINNALSTNAYLDEYNSLATNDNQVVYQYSDNCKMVINIENGAVSAVEHYYLFDTAKEALNSDVGSYYKNQNVIGKILIDGSSVKVIFKSAVVNGMSREEIEQRYNNLPLVK